MIQRVLERTTLEQCQLVTSDCSVSGIENLTKTKERNWLTPGLPLLWDKTDMVKVFEVCPLDRQLLNNTTKVVLRRVTYFLVGCIRFIDVMALGSLSLSSCCWERSACEKTAQLLAKYIHDKKWKGKCKPLEFGTDFADTATSLLVHPEASRVSFQLLIPPTNTAEAQNRLGNHSKLHHFVARPFVLVVKERANERAAPEKEAEGNRMFWGGVF